MSPTPPPRRSIVFKIGVALLVLYALMWLFVPVIPFLPLPSGQKAAIAGVDMVAAEIILLVAIACVGKETYHAVKDRFLRRRGRAPESHLDAARPDAARPDAARPDATHPGAGRPDAER